MEGKYDPCQQKSRQCINASENDKQEPCRENMRRSKFQGYVVPERYFDKHICTFLTSAGLRAHST